jgi:putative oxidoreductase
MDALLMRYAHLGLPIFRIAASLMMLTHGYPKLMKLFAGGEIEFYDFMGMGAGISLFLAVIGEFFAPLLIIAGYQTRYAAFLAAFTMGVAAFVVHAGDPFGDKETAMLYFFSFFMILLSGPGAFSIDGSGTSSK